MCEESVSKVCVTIIIEIQNELNVNQITMDKGHCFALIRKHYIYTLYLWYLWPKVNLELGQL